MITYNLGTSTVLQSTDKEAICLDVPYCIISCLILVKMYAATQWVVQTNCQRFGKLQSMQVWCIPRCIAP